MAIGVALGGIAAGVESGLGAISGAVLRTEGRGVAFGAGVFSRIAAGRDGRGSELFRTRVITTTASINAMEAATVAIAQVGVRAAIRKSVSESVILCT